MDEPQAEWHSNLGPEVWRLLRGTLSGNWNSLAETEARTITGAATATEKRVACILWLVNNNEWMSEWERRCYSWT